MGGSLLAWRHAKTLLIIKPADLSLPRIRHNPAGFLSMNCAPARLASIGGGRKKLNDYKYLN